MTFRLRAWQGEMGHDYHHLFCQNKLREKKNKDVRSQRWDRECFGTVSPCTFVSIRCKRMLLQQLGKLEQLDAVAAFDEDVIVLWWLLPQGFLHGLYVLELAKRRVCVALSLIHI